MTQCTDSLADYGCQNACCYFPVKRITSDEALRLERFIQVGNNYFLDNDLKTGACVFLDTEQWSCSVYDQRPAVCRDYSCRSDNDIWTLINHILEGGEALQRPVQAWLDKLVERGDVILF